MLMLDDLKKFTEKIRETSMIKDVESMDITLKVQDWNLKSLDNELFKLTGKNESEHHECSSINLTMSGVNYHIQCR